MRNYSIAFRISLIVAITILSGFAIAGTQIFSLRQTIHAEREQKVRDMVDGALKLIKTYDDEVRAGHLSLEAAQGLVKTALRAMRWGNGEYFGVYEDNGVTLVHANARNEGVNRIAVEDPNGKRIVADLIAAARDGGGLVSYMVPRGASASETNGAPLSKMAYANAYAPWNWVVQTGVYVDDIDATLWGQFLWIGGAESIVLVVAGLLGYWIARSVSRPVAELVAAIADIDPARPGAWRCPSPEKDELGQIVRSLDDLTRAFQLGLEQRDTAREESARLSGELNVSRQMQQILLPSRDELGAIAGLEVAAVMEPATEVGGDYYDILRHAGGVRIGIGDVTGHGLESGIIMLMIQSAVRILLTSQRHGLKDEINVINMAIYENIKRMGCEKNLSLALLEYSPEDRGSDPEETTIRGTLQFCGQHEYMIVARANGRIEIVDTDDLGFPIGLIADISEFVSESRVQLYFGDVVVLYTDGVTEAADAEDRFYGLERLAEVASRHRALPAEAIKTAIFLDVKRHIGNAAVHDDLTLIVLKQL